MHKTLKIVSQIVLLLMITGCSVVYKFEAEQEKYSDLFPRQQHKNTENSTSMEFYNNYYGDVNSINSIYLPRHKNETWINIEHLLKVVDFDVSLLPELTHNNYLFSSVEIHKNIELTKLNVQHYYKGVKLKKFQTYIYRESKEKNSKHRFSVAKLEDVGLLSDEQYAVVTIYEMPISIIKTKVLP